MYDKAVKITWKAFSNNPHRPARPETSLTFDAKGLFDGQGDYDICNQVFEDTNLYRGIVWEQIKNNLPQDRTHTALSVGDEITIYDYTDDRKTSVYSCASTGWTLESYDIEINPRKNKRTYLQEV